MANSQWPCNYLILNKMAQNSGNPAHDSVQGQRIFGLINLQTNQSDRDMKDHQLWNRILRIIAGSYVIVFMPLLLSYLALEYFTAFSGRLLLYALIPLAAVLLILFTIYCVRVARTGHFWSSADDQRDFETVHNTEQ